MELGKVLVTGATGQVGRRLVAALAQNGQSVTVLTRSATIAQALWPDGRIAVRQADVTDPRSLEHVCEGIKTLFHMASYAPGANEPDLYNAPRHWAVTAEGTAALMARVAESSIEQILYISTIKVMGEGAGASGRPVDETLTPAPDTLYGQAKLAAERSVLTASQEAGIKGCVLRLPMVYGLDGTGNIARMITAVAAGRFPPWPRIENRRSAIHVEDVVSAVLLAAGREQSNGQTYFVTDGRAYSTRWLYERILNALERPVPGWTVPLWALRTAAAGGSLAERLFGRRMPLTLDGLSKLTGDAWYSSEKLERMLGFTPLLNLENEIVRLVRKQLA